MPQISSDNPAASEIPAWINGSRGYVAADLVMTRVSPSSRATLIPGSLPAGAVLGKITSSGLYALCDATQTDGRQTPVAVLDSIANPATGRFALVRTDGTFNSNFLLWHASWTLPTLGAAMAAAGMPVLTRGFGSSF